MKPKITDTLLDLIELERRYVFTSEEHSGILASIDALAQVAQWNEKAYSVVRKRIQEGIVNEESMETILLVLEYAHRGTHKNPKALEALVREQAKNASYHQRWKSLSECALWLLRHVQKSRTDPQIIEWSRCAFFGLSNHKRDRQAARLFDEWFDENASQWSWLYDVLEYEQPGSKLIVSLLEIDYLDGKTLWEFHSNRPTALGWYVVASGLFDEPRQVPTDGTARLFDWGERKEAARLTLKKALTREMSPRCRATLTLWDTMLEADESTSMVRLLEKSLAEESE